MSVLSELAVKAQEVVGTLEVEGSNALSAAREFVATLEQEVAKEADAVGAKVEMDAQGNQKTADPVPADTVTETVDPAATAPKA